MKKILLSTLILFSFTSAFSQVWDTIEAGNYGLQNFITRSMEIYKGRVVVGGGFYNPDEARIVYSFSGNQSSFSEDFGFTSASAFNNSQFVDVLKKTDDGNYLFAGVSTYQDDPHVYRFDGSAWIDFGNIPYAFGDSSWYEGVTAMSFYTTTGTNDSLYIALNPSPTGQSNGIGAQIYRTSINAATWQFVDSLSLSDGKITAMKTFNGKLYFSNEQYSRVFSNMGSANHIAVTDTGFYNGNYTNSITSLEIYNNELYAGTDVQDSTELWKTADGNTWTMVGPRSLLTNIQLGKIHDMKVLDNKLWILAFSVGPPAMVPQGGVGVNAFMEYPHVVSWDGLAFTNTSLELESTDYDHDKWSLAVSPHTIYAAGANSWDGNHMYKGCFSFVPTFSMIDTTCLFHTMYMVSDNKDVGDAAWYWDGSYYANGDSINAFLTVQGTHYAALVITNGACVDSLADSVFVNPSFTVDSITPFAATVCANTDVTFTAYVSTGTAPYNYSWTFSGGVIGSGQSVTLQAVGNGSVSVNVYDTHGCYTSYSSNLYTNPSTDIKGSVNYSGGQIDSGFVFLIKEGTSSADYDTVATTPISSSPAGEYIFTGITAGTYIIRAEADTSVFPQAISTYYGDHYLWDSAWSATHGCAIVDSFAITISEIASITGPGSIDGYVYEGAGFGQKVMPGPIGVMANVIPGVPVKVGKNPSGTIVASTITDSTGHYHIDNLPYDDYRIYTDIPGYPMDSSYVITLAAGSDSLVNLDYYVDSNSVYIDLSTGIHLVMTDNLQSFITTFPNPARDNATIVFDVEESSDVSAELFNLQGEKIAVILNRRLNKGHYTENINFEQYNISGGTYLMKMNLNNNCYLIKMVVIR